MQSPLESEFRGAFDERIHQWISIGEAHYRMRIICVWKWLKELFALHLCLCGALGSDCANNYNRCAE